MAALASVPNAKMYCGATIGDFFHLQLHLFSVSSLDFKFSVSSKYVVTAAHCLQVTTEANTMIVVGEHNIKTG